MRKLNSSVGVTKLAGVVAVLAGGVAASRSAHAATFYTVQNNAVDTLNNNGQCSLRKAIKAANTHAAVDACPAGSTDWNSIQIVGNPATTLSLTLGISIAVTVPIAIYADFSSRSSYQIVSGGASPFVVSGGGQLSVQGISFQKFTSPPFSLTSGTSFNATDTDISSSGTIAGSPQTMGIFNNGGSVVLYNVTMHNLGLSVKGGAILNQNGSLDVSYSSLYNNQTDQYGGAIYNTGGNVRLFHVTLSGNQVLRTNSGFGGGGLYNTGNGTADVIWSTITANRSLYGSGISRFSGTVRVKHSIVGGNALSNDCNGAITSQGYNLLTLCSATTTTGDITGYPPALNPLQFPSGSQPFYLAPWHTPKATSPALNQIPDGAEECSSVEYNDDQIYNSRFVGSRCDMGAIERQAGETLP